MDSGITIGGLTIKNSLWEQKGKSIIDFLTDYCVINVETTGHSVAWDDIIEIGAIRYSNGKEVARFQTMVQPPECDDYYVDEFIEELTGITNDMLSEAHSAPDAIYIFSQFLGDSVIVGYDVDFGLSFLNYRYMRYLGRPLTNDFVDVMRIAKKLHPELEHHRLKDMLAYYGIARNKEHRSIINCIATQCCYEKLREEITAKYGDLESFLRDGAKREGALVSAEDVFRLNPESPFYRKHCVIDDKFDNCSRAQALQLIANLGGIVDSSVTSKTNFLIIGNRKYRNSIINGKGMKQRKAEDCILKGQDIEIIAENALYDMIAEFVRSNASAGPSGTLA